MADKINHNPYEVIIEKMKEYPAGIPMRDGQVSPAFEEYQTAFHAGGG